MTKLKTNEGITLIALIITIIVMLILVGVTVTISLNGGLFSTAKNATSKTQIEIEKEQLLSIALGTLDDKGMVDFDKLKEAIKGTDFTEEDGGYISTKSGNEYVISERGNITEAYKAYSIGDEIIVEGESFYVIAKSDKTQEKVTLLAKYNLNAEGTAQDTTGAINPCEFSSKAYWPSGTEGSLNLNIYEVPEGVTSIVTISKKYGQAKGGEGRLLTYSEASALVTNHSEIIFGGADDGFLNYWLSSTDIDEWVWYADGYEEDFLSYGFDLSDYNGIRPVIEISKSLIS